MFSVLLFSQPADVDVVFLTLESLFPTVLSDLLMTGVKRVRFAKHKDPVTCLRGTGGGFSVFFPGRGTLDFPGIGVSKFAGCRLCRTTQSPRAFVLQRGTRAGVPSVGGLLLLKIRLCSGSVPALVDAWFFSEWSVLPFPSDGDGVGKIRNSRRVPLLLLSCKHQEENRNSTNPTLPELFLQRQF